MKHRIKLTESELRNIIKESVKKVMYEATSQKRRDVFSVYAFNDTQDEGVDFFPETATTYYNADKAIRVAEKLAKEYQNESDRYTFSVYAGEYEMPNGDVFGEPFDIYSVSNHD